jgi:hypothetical protein
MGFLIEGFMGERKNDFVGWAARIAAVILTLAGIVCDAGCSSRRGVDVTYHDPNMDFSLIQTAAVMPFDNLTSNQNASEAVRDVFMTMLQATGAVYVLPPGEVGRGISRLSLSAPSQLSSEEAVQFAAIVGADVVITGTVSEYGQLRSGGSSANVASVSVKMLEAQTGRVVWSAASSAGGVSASDRVFGGGGRPMDDVTRAAVEKLLNRLFH